MTTKQTNRYLLTSVLVGMVFDFVLNAFLGGIPFDLCSALKYLAVFALGFGFLKKSGMSFQEALPYHVPMKGKTALWVVITVILVQPVMTSLSKLGALLFGDVLDMAMTMVEDKGVRYGFAESFFTMAVIPAVFEEMFYRGFFYAGYKKGRGTRVAILLTAFLFGTFHMIAQQALYAVFAGLVLAALRELSGSMWPGMLFHLLNNGWSVVESYLAENPVATLFMPDTWFHFNDTPHAILTLCCCAAAIPLLYLTLKQMARTEGKEEEWKTLFKSEKKSLPAQEEGEALIEKPEKILTAALVGTLVIQGLVMLAMSLFSKLWHMTA